MAHNRPDRDQSLNQATGLGRWTVRHRLSDGTVTDVVGHLLEIDEEHLRIRDRYGNEHRILRSAVIASRRVPDQPPRRRRSRDV